MKINLKIIISTLLISLCGVFLFLFRSVPVSRIWKSYQVLYVDASVDEQSILNYLHDSGCKDVISLSEQKQPLFSPFTPIEPGADKTGYLNGRLDYFADKESKYRLFYIPEQYEKQTERAVTSIVTDKNVRVGLDGKSNFPVLVPCVCIALFLILLIVSQNKSVFFTAGLFPVLYTLSKPFYPLASAVILLLLSFFLGERFWKRKGAIGVVFLNMYTDILTIAGISIAFISSWKSGVLLLLVLCASVAGLLILNEVQAAADAKKAFTYTFILPAKQFPIMYSRTARYTLVSICAIVVLITFFLLSARFVPQASVSGIALPSPQKENAMGSDDKVIPSLRDYFVWAWDITTFPYRNLNVSSVESEPVKKGDKVTVTQFKETKTGVEPYEETIYSFDNGFMNDAEKEIDNLDYPAIEKLMKKQGDGITVTYSEKSSGETKTDSTSLVLLLISMGIPIILYLYYSISGRRKYENGK